MYPEQGYTHDTQQKRKVGVQVCGTEGKEGSNSPRFDLQFLCWAFNNSVTPLGLLGQCTGTVRDGHGKGLTALRVDV